MRLFTPKGRQLVGVDVSSTSIKMVEVQRRQGLFQLASYGIEPLSPGQVVDKTIVDIEATGEAISRLIKRLKPSSSNAATAVSGAAVITKIIDMDARLSDSEREAVLHLDADQYIPYPLSEVNMDFEVLGPSSLDDNQVQVLLAASRSENVDQRVDALAFGGLTTKVVDIESHAIERAFGLIADTIPKQPEVVALFDIGHTQTTLYVARDGEFIYSRDQLFGGIQLTEAIQNRYGLSYEEAYHHKHNQTLPADYRSEVLLPFAEDLIQQITRSLQFYFSSSQHNNVEHIMLCGGSAAIPGLTDLIAQNLGTPASVANPFINMTVASQIDTEQLAADAPSLMAACGLALRSFD